MTEQELTAELSVLRKQAPAVAVVAKMREIKKKYLDEHAKYEVGQSVQWHCPEGTFVANGMIVSRSLVHGGMTAKVWYCFEDDVTECIHDIPEQEILPTRVVEIE